MHKQLAPLLAEVHLAQGHLLGRMHDLGLDLRDQASLRILTEDVLKTSEIEGEKLNPDSVRSSVARRQVVSGPLHRQKVHYEAPPAHLLKAEMSDFLNWFNVDNQDDPVVKAGLAHLWFVTVHPFEDGNGRIARAVGDMALARAEKSVQRFYSLSAQIQQEHNGYYDRLEATQKGDLHVTAWLI